MLARVAALVVSGARHAPAAWHAARCLATQASGKPGSEIVLPDAPLSLSGTSGSIATLVWQLAAKENQLEKVQDELWQVIEVFRESKPLRLIAVDPFMPVPAKVTLVKKLLADSPATEITKRLFESLAESNALAATLDIATHFDDLMLAHKKEVHCTIVTAQPLDKLGRVELVKQAQAFVQPGFKLVMQEKVDRKLVGGFILEFEDRLVDMSAAKKLEEFNNLVFKLENDLRV